VSKGPSNGRGEIGAEEFTNRRPQSSQRIDKCVRRESELLNIPTRYELIVPIEYNFHETVLEEKSTGLFSEIAPRRSR
jgi:hypothetical protein